ncbi:ATP-grasp domain-containing protein [Pelistega ratti]|uniref:ATP-grasp domain-containing protein n=1 Tax=Pelistega ratti TaxID=2652177 RepID=UPI001358EA2A|nr:ATP-grasp domain-containing protein [Pelistega ratti]
MNIVLVEALTFGLGRLVKAAQEMNVTLHLLTYNKAFYFYELNQIESKHLVVYEIDTFNPENIIAYCQNLNKFGGIISLTDTWAMAVQEILPQLGLKAQNATTICRHKDLFRQKLLENNLTSGTVNIIYPKKGKNTIPDNIHYPVIIKDPSGTGSKSVWFAENDNELSHLLDMIGNNEQLEKVLIETYFKGTLFSAETISFKGETKILAISSRILSDIPLFMEKAISLPINTNHQELSGVEEWIKKILSCIAYTDGFAHIEFIVTPNGFEVVEVNPRLGGIQIGEALCQSYDTNIYKAFIEIAVGKRPSLLDMTLIPKIFTAQVVIYAKQTGYFKGINDKYINKERTKIFPYAQSGKKIDTITDQSACVGILMTTAQSSEIALLNAISEANKVIVQMEAPND